MAASEFLTEDQIDVISWLSGIVSGFSIVGSSFIVFCYLRFKHLRKFAFTLVSCSSTGRRSSSNSDSSSGGTSGSSGDTRKLTFEASHCAQVFILSLTDLMNQLGDFMQPSSEEILRARQNVEGDTSALCYLQVDVEREREGAWWQTLAC